MNVETSVSVTPSGAEVPTGRVVDLDIEGLHCAGCVRSVEKALHAVSGVDAADVNLAMHTAGIALLLRRFEPAKAGGGT